MTKRSDADRELFVITKAGELHSLREICSQQDQLRPDAAGVQSSGTWVAYGGMTPWLERSKAPVLL
jgi:hypothetical protein